MGKKALVVQFNANNKSCSFICLKYSAKITELYIFKKLLKLLKLVLFIKKKHIVDQQTYLIFA